MWQTLSHGAVFAAEVILLKILIDEFGAIGTWQKGEVVFLYAVNFCSHGLAGIFFFQPCALMTWLVRRGELDDALTRPVNTFWFLVFKHLSFPYLSQILLAFGLILYSLMLLVVEITLVKLAFLLLVLASGAVIQGAVQRGLSIAVFRMVDAYVMMEALWETKKFVQYPLSIYPRSFQVFFTIVLPFAFIGFFPSQYFLSKDDFLMFSPSFQFLSPLIAAVFYMASEWIWNRGLAQYRSTGT